MFHVKHYLVIIIEKSSNVSRETSETKELYLNYNRISLFFIAKTAA